MKNLKKLVSSVLAVALLAGSAACLSCSAAKGKGKKQETSSQPIQQISVATSQSEQPAQPDQNGIQEVFEPSSVDQKTQESAKELKINLVNNPPKKDPLPGERILKMNPYLGREIDELYNPQGDDDLARINSCDKALTALDKLKKVMLKSSKYDATQKEIIKEDIELLKQMVNFRKAKLKGSLTDSMKDSLRKIERKLKNAISSLMPYVLKIGAASLIVGVCYLIGYQGFEFITKCLWALIGGGLKIIGGAVWNILSGFGSGTYNLGSFAYNCFNSTNPNCTAYNLFFGNLTELFPGNLN